jgi:hypothetical protein
MSGSKVLEKFTKRVALSDEPEGLAEDIDDLGAFGFLRGLHERSVMVSLRKKSGDIHALGYGFIDRIAFDPSEGITIFCGSRSVRIKGKNLNKEVRPNVSLFVGLTQHRIPWIAEADQTAVLHAARDAVVVEAIDW